MKNQNRRLILLATLILSGAFSKTLHADDTKQELSYCNMTDKEIRLSLSWNQPKDDLGDPNDTQRATSGWRPVPPHQCVNAATSLTDTHIKVYAEAIDNSRVWGGDSALCVDTSGPYYFGAPEEMPCDQKNQMKVGFRDWNVEDKLNVLVLGEKNAGLISSPFEKGQKNRTKRVFLPYDH